MDQTLRQAVRVGSFCCCYCFHCVRRRKKPIIQIGVEIVWDNIELMDGSWNAYLASPADFTGADEIHQLGGVSNGLCEHLRACGQCVYFCEHEQLLIFSCEQRAV